MSAWVQGGLTSCRFPQHTRRHGGVQVVLETHEPPLGRSGVVDGDSWGLMDSSGAPKNLSSSGKSFGHLPELETAHIQIGLTTRTAVCN